MMIVRQAGHSMKCRAVPRWMIVTALLLLVMTSLAQAATGTVPIAEHSSVAPTTADVERYTRPLVKARLRIPDSLHGFVVTKVVPMVNEPSRFEVEVRFRARTPFGVITEQSARFRMKKASGQGAWIVTAE